jgi:aryl-alcohol dehydrogenase-like predicted oxidoreductase
MERTALGASDLTVSRLCLGTMLFGDVAAGPWRLDEDAAARLVAEAIDLGVNFFDTGNTYGRGQAETVLGRALKAAARREDVVVATKVYFPTGDGPDDRGLSRAAIRKAIDASLLRLGTDHVDLYMVHRWDAAAPIEETLETLDSLVRAGKVRALGASSMTASQFRTALDLQAEQGWSPFVCMQGHLNLLYREEEAQMLPLCRARGVAVTAWSPLARGVLAGADTGGRLGADALAGRYTQEGGGLQVLAAAQALARRRQVPLSQIALAWLWSKAGVTGPVLGATSGDHLRSAVDAMALRLNHDEITALEAAYRPRSVIGYGDAEERPRRG